MGRVIYNHERNFFLHIQHRRGILMERFRESTQHSPKNLVNFIETPFWGDLKMPILTDNCLLAAQWILECSNDKVSFSSQKYLLNLFIGPKLASSKTENQR